MSPQQMLADLIGKRKKIDLAIAGVQGLVEGKRGRPSKEIIEARRIAANGKPKRQPKSPA